MGQTRCATFMTCTCKFALSAQILLINVSQRLYNMMPLSTNIPLLLTADIFAPYMSPPAQRVYVHFLLQHVRYHNGIFVHVYTAWRRFAAWTSYSTSWSSIYIMISIICQAVHVYTVGFITVVVDPSIIIHAEAIMLTCLLLVLLAMVSIWPHCDFHACNNCRAP